FSKISLNANIQPTIFVIPIQTAVISMGKIKELHLSAEQIFILENGYKQSIRESLPRTNSLSTNGWTDSWQKAS
ncbi:MAG: hypothetical protein LBH04_05130, partial [Tannerellaceae bacterium]|nr:hypothetical protein [Tannerellaceae bacterium]